MDFLVDQAVSWRVARALTDAGHDAVHVRDVGLASASDEEVLHRASAERRVIITQDSDFGTLLAVGAEAFPSVILMRLRTGSPDIHARLLLDNLDAIQGDLEKGAIVVVTDASIRIRRLKGE